MRKFSVFLGIILFVQINVHRAGNRCNLAQRILQKAQAAQRLCSGVPATASFLLCRFVFQLDLFQQLCQCHACSSSRSTPAPAKCANRIPAAYVYVSDQGTKYHRDADCSGMIDPDRIALEDARSMGLAPCQKCC